MKAIEFNLGEFLIKIKHDHQLAIETENKLENYLGTVENEGMYADDVADTYSDSLKSQLDRLKIKLVYGLERLGCTISVANLISELKEIKDGFGSLKYNPEYDFYWSEPRSIMKKYIDAIDSEVSAKKVDDDGNLNLKMVERILKNTGSILFQHDIVPSKEKDVKDSIFRILSASFPDCIREFNIPHEAAMFKPDIGIKNMSLAVEYKYCDSKEKLNKCIGGIFEDVHAYAGTKDWTRFVSVIYCNDNYTSQDAINGTMKSAKVPENWKIFLCIGPTIKK